MRMLFIGGTGLISSALSPLVVSRGHDLTLINRGTSLKADAPQGAHVIVADVNDTASFRAAIKSDVAANGHYDAVVQWIGFDPDHISRDIETFAGVTRQYVFISSASAYETPPGFYIARESTTPGNTAGTRRSRRRGSSPPIVKPDSRTPWSGPRTRMRIATSPPRSTRGRTRGPSSTA
jgi:nucleoside-diphosphate-sugar epimerase